MTKSATAYQESLREMPPMSHAVHVNSAAESGMIKMMLADVSTVSTRRPVEYSDESGTHTHTHTYIYI